MTARPYFKGSEQGTSLPVVVKCMLLPSDKGAACGGRKLSFTAYLLLVLRNGQAPPVLGDLCRGW